MSAGLAPCAITCAGDGRGIGHTPLGALSVLASFARCRGASRPRTHLGRRGRALHWAPRLVTTDTSDKARDLHELWFNVILALIVLHVGAIIYYRLRGRCLTKPMITGRAALDPAAEPMQPGKWWAAVICLAIAIGVTRWIIAGAPPFGS